MPHFTYQESIPFNTGNAVDTSGRVKKVKAKDQRRSLNQLPKNKVGSRWILVKEED